MKVVVVWDRAGTRPLVDEHGELTAFPGFKWIHREENPPYLVHLLAFCSATTEDYAFQMFQGLIAVGWNRGPVVFFTPRNIPIHISLKGGLHALYRRLLRKPGAR